MNTKQQAYYQQLNDKELIARIVQDDAAAVEYLFFVKCRPMFQRIVYQLFSNNVEVEELIGEFYLYVRKNDWAKLKSFEGKSSLMTWLTVVATRFFVNNRQDLVNLQDTIAQNVQDLTNQLQSNDQIINKLELYDAVFKIPNPKYRWVILADLNGNTSQEMSIALQTTIGNIYNYRKRGIIELKEIINEWKHV